MVRQTPHDSTYILKRVVQRLKSDERNTNNKIHIVFKSKKRKSRPADGWKVNNKKKKKSNLISALDKLTSTTCDYV